MMNEVHALLESLESMRSELRNQLTFQQTIVLMHIACQPGAHATAIQDCYGMDVMTVANALLKLGAGRIGAGDRVVLGLRLIEHYQDPADRRIRRYKLTALGEKTAMSIASSLQPQRISPSPRQHIDRPRISASSSL